MSNVSGPGRHASESLRSRGFGLFPRQFDVGLGFAFAGSKRHWLRCTSEVRNERSRKVLGFAGQASARQKKRTTRLVRSGSFQVSAASTLSDTDRVAGFPISCGDVGGRVRQFLRGPRRTVLAPFRRSPACFRCYCKTRDCRALHRYPRPSWRAWCRSKLRRQW